MNWQVKVGSPFSGGGTSRGEVEPLQVGSDTFAIRQVFEGSLTVYVYGLSDCHRSIDDEGDPVVTVETVDDHDFRLSIGVAVAELLGIEPKHVFWPLNRSGKPILRPRTFRTAVSVF